MSGSQVSIFDLCQLFTCRIVSVTLENSASRSVHQFELEGVYGVHRFAFEGDQTDLRACLVPEAQRAIQQHTRNIHDESTSEMRSNDLTEMRRTYHPHSG